MPVILIIILVILLFGAFPHWGYNRNWGYGPTSFIGVILIILLVLFLMGRL
jgi:hypothetical protein